MEIQKTTLELPANLTEMRTILSMESLKIECEADIVTAGEYLKTIKGRIKAIKDKQEELFGPLKRAIKDFEQKVKYSALEPMQKVDEILRRRVAEYMDKMQAQREAEELQRRNALAEKLKDEAQDARDVALDTGSTIALETAERKENMAERIESKPLEVRQTVKTTGHTVAQMRIWRWRVIDEKLVPRGWLALDEKKLNAAARGFTANPIQVDGIQFYEESRVSLRT